MFFRNGLDAEDNERMSNATGLACDPDEDRAVQGDALETNINRIVQRFRTNRIAPPMKGQPVFGDFSKQFDLAEALLVTKEAQDAFAQLPANIRRRFDNDPLELAAFLDDERNREEGEKLGLLRKRPQEGNQEPPAAPLDPPAAPAETPNVSV